MLACGEKTTALSITFSTPYIPRPVIQQQFLHGFIAEILGFFFEFEGVFFQKMPGQKGNIFRTLAEGR